MRKSFMLGVAIAIGATALLPGTASADEGGTPTLADVLLSDAAKDDSDGFDQRRWDYDIVTQAVLLFPDLVAAASNPDAELTVFLPNDEAFRVLVTEITGERVRSEADLFAAVASLGTDTVRSVLLYHIVPASISYSDARDSDGAVLATLLTDSSITVDVRGRGWKFVELEDLDTTDRDPIVVDPNVGGTPVNGFAHGIDRVLRPIDLP